MSASGRGGIRRLFRLPTSVRSLERDVDEEIRFHLESRVEELIAEGQTAEAARERAVREYGDVASSRRELLRVDRTGLGRARRALFWEALARDLAYAARALRRRPAFTAVVVGTIALGVGATAAIYTVVDTALVRPLPYHAPERLVHLWETKESDPSDRTEASYPDFLDWRARTRTFAALEGYDPTNVTVLGDEPLMLRGARVTPGFLAALGVRLHIGRDFDPADEPPDGAPVAIISHELWRQQMGGARAVLGERLTIDGRAHTIIGVLPRAFHFAPLQDAAVWLPIDPSANRTSQRFNHWLNVVGRLREGFDVESARGELAALMRRLAEEHPETNRGRGIDVVPLHRELVGDVRPMLLALLASAVLVLLIACVNVTSMLLARGIERGRETALRLAIGASRAALVRQHLVEGLLIALAGAAIGVWLASLGARGLVAAIPASVRDGMPYLESVALDGRVIALVLVVAIAVGLAVGLAGSAQTRRASVADLMRHGGRGIVSGLPQRLRGALVAGQVALTLALLVGAGLMGRSLLALLSTDPGFRSERVLTLRVALQGATYEEPARQQRFYQELLERVRTLPGVESVGAVRQLPLSGGGTNTFRVEGMPEPDPAHRPDAVMRGVAGDYFHTLGIPIVAGRAFTDGDDATAPGVVMVSASLARQLLGEASPIGRRVRFYAFPDTTWEIVGIVADVKTAALDAPPPPTIYYTHLQGPENRMTLVVRTTREPLALARAIRREASAMDPTVPVYSISTMEETVAESPAMFARRYPLILMSAFALTALVLAVVGIYGVMSYSVTRRHQELGVRAALGALPRDLLGMVLREGVRLVAVGAALGLVASMVLARSLRGLLYGVPQADPITYGAVTLLLLAVALVATWIPARRAAASDPLSALRSD